MDSNKLKERINAKITEMMADLITEEELATMVEAAVAKFFEPVFHADTLRVETGNGRYYDKFLRADCKISILEAMVWDHVIPLARTAIGEYFKAEAEGLKSAGQEVVDNTVKQNYGKLTELASSMQQFQAIRALENALTTMSMATQIATQAIQHGDYGSAMGQLSRIMPAVPR